MDYKYFSFLLQVKIGIFDVEKTVVINEALNTLKYSEFSIMEDI